MKLFTIGFTQTTAESFFSRLKNAGAARLIDVRLNNSSQLSGFAKRDDLAYFARTICGIDYVHMLQLAPEQEMLAAYRKAKTSWDIYAGQFSALIRARRIETLEPAPFDGACLLCSEARPHNCHRRLVAEYLQQHWPGTEIYHL